MDLKRNPFQRQRKGHVKTLKDESRPKIQSGSPKDQTHRLSWEFQVAKKCFQPWNNPLPPKKEYRIYIKSPNTHYIITRNFLGCEINFHWPSTVIRGGLALTQIFLLFSEKTCILALGAGSISLGSLQVARYCSDAVNVEFLRCFGQMLKEEERNLDLKRWNGKTHRTFVCGYIYISSLPFFFSHRLSPSWIHICSMVMIFISFCCLNQGRVAVHRLRYISCSSEWKLFCRNIPLLKKWVHRKMFFRLKHSQSTL